MGSLNGRIVLVTGGAQGIGKAIALRMAREGADIAIFDLDLAEAERTAAAIRALGCRALPLAGNVAEPADVDAAVSRTEAELGPVAVLVNNAGICRVAPFVDTSIEDVRETFRVNFEGMFLFCKAVVPGMIDRRAGVILNMSSWAGKSGRAFFAAYSASKFAVLGLTQALAAELGSHGIRVNALCPGIVVSTRMRLEIEAAHRRWKLPDTKTREQSIPLGRTAEPEDIAPIAAFLASDEAGYITGEAINISGGLYMN